MEIWAEIWNHLGFFCTCLLIVAALVAVAKLAEHFLPGKRKVSPIRWLTLISICASIATILYLMDFPMPFLAPGFYKLDFSELPVMLCGFYLGPAAAVACEAVKVLLKLLLKSTDTAFVGDFANFVVGCSFVLPAAIIYQLKKTRSGALWGLITGTLILTIFGSAFNAVYLLPKFAQLYVMPLEQIIAVGSQVNPAINNVSTFVLFAVAPLNLIKGTTISILTMLLYKRVARPLFDIQK